MARYIKLDIKTAGIFGLAAAAVLYEVADWIAYTEKTQTKKDSENWYKRRWWFRRTAQEWRRESFPFLSEEQIRNEFRFWGLLGVLLRRQRQKSFHRDGWYSIDWRRFRELAKLQREDREAFGQLIAQTREDVRQRVAVKHWHEPIK